MAGFINQKENGSKVKANILVIGFSESIQDDLIYEIFGMSKSISILQGIKEYSDENIKVQSWNMDEIKGISIANYFNNASFDGSIYGKINIVWICFNGNNSLNEYIELYNNLKFLNAPMIMVLPDCDNELRNQQFLSIAKNNFDDTKTMQIVLNNKVNMNVGTRGLEELMKETRLSVPSFISNLL